MDFSNVVCPACRKLVRQPINLICDHNLCFKCAQRLLVVDSESEYQRKFRLACPSCKRSTVTYDLRHLIISCTEYDEDLYVTAKYVADKPEIKLKSPRFDPPKSRETDSPLMKYACKKPSVPSDSERGSSSHKESTTITPKTSNGGIVTSVKCSSHYIALKYYCEQDKSLLCSECVKWHKDHRLADLKNAHDVIVAENSRNKEESKSKLSEVKKFISVASESKKSLSMEFDQLMGTLDSEFKWLHEELTKKQHELAASLKNIYMMKIEEQTIMLSDLSELQKTLAEYNDYSFRDFDSQVYFFNLYANSRKKLQVQQPANKPAGYVWERNREGFYEAIERFMKLKQGAQTGKPPAPASDHQRKKSSHNASYLEMLSANVSRKGSSVCEQDLKDARQQQPVKGSKQKENYKPAPSNVLQLDLKRLKF